MAPYNPHRVVTKVCYVLVNHLTGGHPPLILGLFHNVDLAIDAFAANFELQRVENRAEVIFRARWATPTPWMVHEVTMNFPHAMGILHDTFSIALKADLQYRVGHVVVEPSQKQKEAAARLGDNAQ